MTETETPGLPVIPGKRHSLYELMGLLKGLDDMLIRCMRCGFCQSVCPVYGASFREADVARGKVSLLEDLGMELTRDAKGVGERLNRCLLCGACEKNCPSGARLMDIFISARALVASYLGLGPIKRLIFSLILPRPRLFNLSLSFLSIFQYPFLKSENKTLGTSSVPIMIPILGRRHVPSIPFASFSEKMGSISTVPKKGSPKVAFFPGCVPDKLFPELSMDSLKVLKHHGVGVFMPKNLVCCGIPLLSSGDRDGFITLVKENLHYLSQENFDYLVTPCASCAATIVEHWYRFREYFGLGERAFISHLHEKTRDMTSFMVNDLKLSFPKPPTPPEDSPELPIVTYHDPCHLRKSLNVWEEPREILKSLPAYRYQEMPEAERCCGNGGSFNLSHYDLSLKIGQRKRESIESVSPQVVATSCPACMLQLMDLLSQNHDDIKVRHVLELYAETLPEEDAAKDGAQDAAKDEAQDAAKTDSQDSTKTPPAASERPEGESSQESSTSH
ncbi:MAG: (Fe-S)-binding protein [Deltaproteobacteria bacterium]|jgi:glycolate oxidase iron-sulfur subunit|nr:(Fe-S)-binding protein [Deltaproteobacteria bacterium]